MATICFSGTFPFARFSSPLSFHRPLRQKNIFIMHNQSTVATLFVHYRATELDRIVYKNRCYDDSYRLVKFLLQQRAVFFTIVRAIR